MKRMMNRRLPHPVTQPIGFVLLHPIRRTHRDAVLAWTLPMPFAGRSCRVVTDKSQLGTIQGIRNSQLLTMSPRASMIFWRVSLDIEIQLGLMKRLPCSAVAPLLELAEVENSSQLSTRASKPARTQRHLPSYTHKVKRRLTSSTINIMHAIVSLQVANNVFSIS